MNKTIIAFNQKTGDGFRKYFDEQASLLNDIHALEKFAIVFEIYEYLKKNPKIKKWAIVLTKTEYNDEGLREGAYVDITTDANKIINTPNWDLDSIYEEIETKKHTDLNNILDKYSDIDALPYAEYENNEQGMNNMIKDFIGDEYLIRYQQGTLDASITQSTKKNKPNKM